MSARVRYEKIPWVEDPLAVYRDLTRPNGRVLLESARHSRTTGRYSVVASDPFLILRYENSATTLEWPRLRQRQRSARDPFLLLQENLDRHTVAPESAPPFFTTGAIGYVGYECKSLIEPRAFLGVDKERQLPDMYFAFYDQTLVWDHLSRELTYCSLSSPKGVPSLLKHVRNSHRGKRSLPKRRPPLELECSMDRAAFERAVRRTKEHIRRGDIFQANLSQRFSFLLKDSPVDVYERLRRINPSPFFGLLDAGDFQIISGSPERLVKLEQGTLQTRPIAGTRRRGRGSAEDKQLSEELLLSEKERAEHIMLVDLERNDLGRVAEYGSVTVDELMVLEDYSHVKHIVSNVRGALKEGLTATDALKAFFPGGTITGAPKVRCMQIIDELEPVARGPYTGSLGYLGFDGQMDFNILIRSLAVRDGRASLHVGAGIVADSDPKKEYDETLYKAEAVLSAVFGEGPTRDFFRRCGVGARLS